MEANIALVQMQMSVEKSENLLQALDKIREAAGKGADIVCLPELFTTPYFPQEEKADANSYAEEMPGETTNALSKAARENGVVLVGGSIYEKDGKSFYNSSTIFGEDGKMLAKYRKVHVPHDENFFEQNYFSAGSEFVVVKTKFAEISPLICFDQWFPEAARECALGGAKIIFYPTAIGTVKGVAQAEGNWHHSWETVMRGHAIANSVIVCAANRVGTEGKITFWGGSFICDAFGKVLARGGSREEIVFAKVDLSHGKSIREGWKFFANRKPQTYKKIVGK